MSFRFQNSTIRKYIFKTIITVSYTIILVGATRHDISICQTCLECLYYYYYYYFIIIIVAFHDVVVMECQMGHASTPQPQAVQVQSPISQHIIASHMALASREQQFAKATALFSQCQGIQEHTEGHRLPSGPPPCHHLATTLPPSG